MATLTLHDVPDELLSYLEQRALAHGRSLNSEVLAALETLDTASGPPPAGETSADHAATDPSPMDPSVAISEAALAKIRATLARFPGSAKAAQQPRDPEAVREELELFARLRKIGRAHV